MTVVKLGYYRVREKFYPAIISNTAIKPFKGKATCIPVYLVSPSIFKTFIG